MSLSNFTLPVLTINGYLWDTMKQIQPSLSNTRNYGRTIPFFPMSDSASGTKSWETKTYVIYDRMLRMTGSPFPYIKKEHILYAVKGKEESTFEWSMAFQYILDRMDDAAQDINDWNRSQDTPAGVYFHNLRVFQSNRMSSQARDFSNRPFYITEFIVEAEYHLTDSLESFLS
jgi:hypothetical protein